MSDSGLELDHGLPPAILYPVASDVRFDWREWLETSITTPFVQHSERLRKRAHHDVVSRVAARGDAYRQMSDDDLQDATKALRLALHKDGCQGDARVESFALVRELAERHLGQRPFDVQIIGASALLSGMLAEMETGEGKTLTVGLAAAVAALSGQPVHVFTVNDYLADRDASLLRPFFDACGLTTGVIIAGKPPAERRADYRADIVYGSNKEIAFDFMRDKLVLGRQSDSLHLKFEQLYAKDARVRRLSMRGLRFAIVDEADSILIDESRTPLIITGATDPDNEQQWAEEALKLSSELVEGDHFRLSQKDSNVDLTEAGEKLLAALGEEIGGVWVSRIRREDAVKKALMAVHFYHRDEHYLVQENKVQIIDEFTGRVMPDRTWSEGLHQVIEVKEGCPATGRRFVQSRMTYQKFFRRYHHLCGLTGTAKEVTRELWQVYRLPVLQIPTNKPLNRLAGGRQVCNGIDEKWSRVGDSVARMTAARRPVLIGTRSVKASEALSQHLKDRGIDHRILNALQDADEAGIIAAAGEAGKVTVATNMAGRGVDIKLGPGVAEAGGLHVILTELHEAGRIDRQLFGRCGRQGDPGSYEEIISLEDSLLETFGDEFLRRMPRIDQFRHAQSRAEKLHSKARRELMRFDQRTSEMLAFSGVQD